MRGMKYVSGIKRNIEPRKARHVTTYASANDAA